MQHNSKSAKRSWIRATAPVTDAIAEAVGHYLFELGSCGCQQLQHARDEALAAVVWVAPDEAQTTDPDHRPALDAASQ